MVVAGVGVGAHWMETSRLSSSPSGSAWDGDGWWNRMWVAWELEGEVGLRKSRLPSGRALLLLFGVEKKSTRAPTRGAVEGVCSPHMLDWDMLILEDGVELLLFWIWSREWLTSSYKWNGMECERGGHCIKYTGIGHYICLERNEAHPLHNVNPGPQGGGQPQDRSCQGAQIGDTLLSVSV